MGDSISLPIDLGDGLVLRRAVASDMDALAEFNAQIHGDNDEPSLPVAASTTDLLGKHRPHPTTTPGDFTIVEDTSNGTIASSLCLIPQTWTYAGVSFPATLIELVGTKAEYRNRGLVRKQFDIVHGWCLDRGIEVQAIAGIQWYYRQFGYEYALGFGTGRVAQRSRMPEFKGEEPFRLREAVGEDAIFIAALEGANRRRWLVTCIRDEQQWRYDIAGRDAASDSNVKVLIVEQPDSTPVGYFAYAVLAGDAPWLSSIEVVDSASWMEVMPSVLRHVLAVEDARGEETPREVFASLELGDHHPAYDALPAILTATRRVYALYMRVGDLPAFLTQITSVLEQRLAGSVAHGYSGELPINFYRGGIRMMFERGKITGITSEQRMESSVAASLPDLSFLKLLFGYRSLAELEDWLPDCRIRTNDARVLLDALFPKQPSFVWPFW